MQLIAVLENAFNISYEQAINELWSASFSLPANDPKNEYCQPFYFVEIFDGDERVDLFRIINHKYDYRGDKVITYNCEHVLATLLDDIMFQYHQTTNLSPIDTLNYILGYQTIPRWQIGRVDYTDIVSFKWESENLLNAIFSIPTAYSDNYLFTWDTTNFPWTLNLVVPPTEPVAEIRYAKNLREISKQEDPRNLVTRLYALGYGEGDNQLTIKKVNNGLPYIDADTIETYGIICGTFIDTTIEDPKTLLAKARTALEQNKRPAITYTVSAADLYLITKDPIDKFVVGATVRIYDPDLGTFDAQVVKKSKDDVLGAPGDISLEISNKVKTIADSNSQLQRAVSINVKYAQGSVNIDSNDYQDNCDPDHPAIIEFYIPDEAVNVNKCLLTYKTEKFRAYETAVGGGGGVTTTSASGGSATNLETTGNAKWKIGQPPGTVPVTDVVEGHSHSVVPHSHYYNLPAHNHNITLPNHEHKIQYGIYESNANANRVTIKVDGKTISDQTSTSGKDVDILSYLDGYDVGKVSRGWHTVEIIPNGLARIRATVVKQIFVQSRGGGTY